MVFIINLTNFQSSNGGLANTLVLAASRPLMAAKIFIGG